MNLYETAKDILTQNQTRHDNHDEILEKVNAVFNENPQRYGKNYYAWRAPLQWKKKMNQVVEAVNLSEEYEIYKTLDSIVIKWKD